MQAFVAGWIEHAAGLLTTPAAKVGERMVSGWAAPLSG
jgi:hypothetical protein